VFTDLLQVVLSDLSKLDIHKLAASWWNKLHQVCKCQLAASLIFSTCISIDAFVRLAASCSIRLAASWWCQQACCNLLTTCSRPVKSATCSKSVAFLAVYVECHIFIVSNLWSRIVTEKNIDKIP
jgi:hypothetical protein